MKSKEIKDIEHRLRQGELPEQWKELLDVNDTNTLLILMWAGRLSRRIDTFYQELLKEFDLQYSDYSTLFLLHVFGSMSPKQLNTYLAISSGGLTKTIQRLEKKRLVSRQADPDDGRGTLVSLSDEGEGVTSKAFKADISLHDKLLGDLSNVERGRIALSLRELLDVFEGNP